MRRILGLAVAVVLSAQTVCAQPAARPADTARFEAAAEAAWRRDELASVTVGIVQGGRLVSTRTVGLADIEGGVAADRRTVYRVGSITKAFTALMLLQLVERGTVHLTDPVSRYYPEIDRIPGRRRGAPPVTLLQLATHTSGLAAEPEHADRYAAGPVRDWKKTLAAALKDSRFETEPGTRYSYSNLGYAVLGAALARAAKQPYVSYVEQHILRPLNMTDTAFEPRPDWGPRLASGYVIEGGAADPSLARAGHAGRGYKVPVGALYTTVDDLAKFLALQMGDGPGSVIKPETLEGASRALISTDRAMSEAYGLGFQLFNNGDVVLQGHAGGLPGYRGLEVFERESRTGYIVLRNAIGGKFGDPVFLIFEAYPASD